MNAPDYPKGHHRPERRAGPPVHGTALVLGTSGLLLLGASGSGKTTLARRAIDRWRTQGHFAALVADDRVVLSRQDDRLVARAPATIAGLAEVAGHGLVRCDAVPAAILVLAATLVPGDTIERMPEPDATIDLGGLRIAHAHVPARSGVALDIIAARLSGPTFPEPAAATVCSTQRMV